MIESEKLRNCKSTEQNGTSATAEITRQCPYQSKTY